jgi:hypothetical protein
MGTEKGGGVTSPREGGDGSSDGGVGGWSKVVEVSRRVAWWCDMYRSSVDHTIKMMVIDGDGRFRRVVY